jgi:hypothetical protein
VLIEPARESIPRSVEVEPQAETGEWRGSHAWTGQTEHDRAFLLHTSILGRLTGPLCDTVTGRGCAQETLERLDRTNLFLVSLDDRAVQPGLVGAFGTRADQSRSDTTLFRA